MRLEILQGILLAFASATIGGGITMLTPGYSILGWLLIGVGMALAFFVWYLWRRETRLKSLKSAMHDAECVWAFWYTGQQAVDDNAIVKDKPTSLEKLLLLKPDLNNPSYVYNTKLAGEDTPEAHQRNIAYVNMLIGRVKSANPKADIYYHSEPLTYSFTIFDKKLEKGKHTPNSKHAWVVIQPIEPKRAGERKDWHKWMVKNKGNDKDKFEAYYQLFLEIEERAESLDF